MRRAGNGIGVCTIGGRGARGLGASAGVVSVVAVGVRAGSVAGTVKTWPRSLRAGFDASPHAAIVTVASTVRTAAKYDCGFTDPEVTIATMRAAAVLATALAAVVLSACGSSSPTKTTAAGQNVSIRVTAPADGSRVDADRVAIRGTVTPGDATVQVLGQAAQVGNGVFTSSVPLHTGKNTIDVVASAPGVAPATITIAVTRGGSATKPKSSSQTTASQPQSTVTGAPGLAGPHNCGGGLTAGANTSCSFAENVRAAYNQTGSGILDVYSPVTGRTYRMYCTAGSTHVCTGGNNASVYFGDAVAYDTGNCGGGLSVGPGTSCGFAANVRAAYESSGSSVVRAFSPATGSSYTMYCTSSSPHVCTGGNNATVYFP